jgi:NTP pyrophosphatase (non-canonical NTP hydrolase)
MSMDQASFILEFQEMQDDMAATNHNNGFVDQERAIDDLENYLFSQGDGRVYARFHPLVDMFKNARVGLKLLLAVGEIGEALEAVRKNLGSDDHIPEFSAEEAEVADAIIRLMNYATDRKLRLAEAIVAKNEFNRNRADHSEAGRAAEHGKRF